MQRLAAPKNYAPRSSLRREIADRHKSLIPASLSRVILSSERREKRSRRSVGPLTSARR